MFSGSSTVPYHLSWNTPTWSDMLSCRFCFPPKGFFSPPRLPTFQPQLSTQSVSYSLWPNLGFLHFSPPPQNNCELQPFRCLRMTPTQPPHYKKTPPPLKKNKNPPMSLQIPCFPQPKYLVCPLSPHQYPLSSSPPLEWSFTHEYAPSFRNPCPLPLGLTRSPPFSFGIFCGPSPHHALRDPRPFPFCSDIISCPC